MSREQPGLARLTYRRLKSASGVEDLDALEERVAVVAEAADENTALGRPLAALLNQVEASLLPLLRAREAASAGGEAPGDEVAETVNHVMAPDPTDQ
ncbi:MAG: hypothetical protein LH468_04850 [Nocardioides sp.]|nr:hypothetical protein [Nocardioides sp.]